MPYRKRKTSILRTSHPSFLRRRRALCRLWTELHPKPPPPIGHPIPLLTPPPAPQPRVAAGLRAACSALLLVASGCQVLTYTGPGGERFTRASLGGNTSVASLAVESDTNGVRRVELKGYANDSSQALGTVTEAAVRAALAGPR
jgi:hypothetical protein